MRRAGVLLIVIAGLSFSACARKGPPAPVFDYGLRTRQEMSALVRRESSPRLPLERKQAEPKTAQKKAPLPRPSALREKTVQKRPLPRPVLSSPSSQKAAACAYSSGLKKKWKRGFIRPVQGRVVSAFGVKPGGLYNDGINIAARHGAPVRASEGGTVAYVGDKLGSYGNLVLIRHAGGMMTAYAHLSAVCVPEGAKVGKGQVVGAVGSTGGVPSPQLHFEIRKAGDAVNPRRYLSEKW